MINFDGVDMNIVRRLEVLGEDTIVIPGCEMESAVTSPTLARNRPCKRHTVKLVDALAAIPGSSVEFAVNPGSSVGIRKRWFVFPADEIECPCPDNVDYYGMLRDISTVEPSEADSSCDVNDALIYAQMQVPAVIDPPASRIYKREGQVFGRINSMIDSPILGDLQYDNNEITMPFDI